MLTKRENLLETIRGGHPDRYVNQYEYLAIVGDPIGIKINGRDTIIRGTSGLNGWGVTIEFPENVPGPFPNTAEDKVVVKDITRWREYVKSPGVIFPEEEWAPFVERANAVDRREQFVAPIVAPGLFEKLHYLVGMEATMIAFYEEPEAVKELIDFLADWEIEAAKETISHLHPDALFHHDDLGSQISSFVSPALFDEFLVPAYQKVYGFWRENGVELIVHHSDSYAQNLVPSLIASGVDIWQGAMSTNDIPAILSQYGGKITLHGGIDNGRVDKPGWTREEVRTAVREAIERNGKRFYIPGAIMGGPRSVYPGVYECITECINEKSAEDFGN